jgi:hypothetical protein
MTETLFPQFPDDAKVWVYALARPLTDAERELVTTKLSSFITQWNSHGAPVHGAFEIVENRFVLIAGYTDGGVGGCSTDSMVRVMKDLRQNSNIDGFDRTLVFFRDANQRVQAVKREEFQELVSAVQVGADTPVFDPTIQFVGDLRRGGFETTFSRSWHAGAFSSSPPR